MNRSQKMMAIMSKKLKRDGETIEGLEAEKMTLVGGKKESGIGAYQLEVVV